MIVCKTIAECRREREKLGKLAFVPTMGALHEGHLSLIREASKHAPHVAVSIFVNPTQFGPNEDFSRYPRPIEADLELCRSAGVDLVFNPDAEEMYPPGSPEISIDLPQLTNVLEGQKRPGHFKGVCQVVAKLFNIVQPQVACFGMKDYQQLCVLQAMVKALDFPITIIPCPTVREKDGLALSSRNRYLSPDERQRALAICRALFAARDEVSKGIRQTNRLVATMQQIILSPGNLGHVPVAVDYIAAVDPTTLRPKEMVDGGVLLAIAARVGNTRLIDNILIESAE
jgi:pantoate--beta-alanine ligase